MLDNRFQHVPSFLNRINRRNRRETQRVKIEDIKERTYLIFNLITCYYEFSIIMLSATFAIWQRTTSICHCKKTCDEDKHHETHSNKMLFSCTTESAYCADYRHTNYAFKRKMAIREENEMNAGKGTRTKQYQIEKEQKKNYNRQKSYKNPNLY